MNENKFNKSLLAALKIQKTQRVPFWFMRQAGRYLPEYRELRAKAGGFLNLVYNPEQASEVTLQPIRRFGMNGAILFSDILVIPQALGQDLKFETGEGPKLNAIDPSSDLNQFDIDKIDETLSPIYETLREVKLKLANENFDDTALIGFAGAPWTVACYMVEGGGSKTFDKTKKWAYGDPESFQKLIDILVQATSHYLIKQIEAGAEAIQLFDSWAGVLNTQNFERWAVKPIQDIVENVRTVYPDALIIGFPRNVGEKISGYANNVDVNAIGLDFSANLKWVSQNVPKNICLQGNLDPVTLLTGGQALESEAKKILETMRHRPFIFNLGHGVIKETPPEHVERLSEIIRDFK